MKKIKYKTIDGVNQINYISKYFDDVKFEKETIDKIYISIEEYSRLLKYKSPTIIYHRELSFIEKIFCYKSPLLIKYGGRNHLIIDAIYKHNSKNFLFDKVLVIIK